LLTDETSLEHPVRPQTCWAGTAYEGMGLTFVELTEDATRIEVANCTATEQIQDDFGDLTEAEKMHRLLSLQQMI
jgi:hypothetical protein